MYMVDKHPARKAWATDLHNRMPSKAKHRLKAKQSVCGTARTRFQAIWLPRRCFFYVTSPLGHHYQVTDQCWPPRGDEERGEDTRGKFYRALLYRSRHFRVIQAFWKAIGHYLSTFSHNTLTNTPDMLTAALLTMTNAETSLNAQLQWAGSESTDSREDTFQLSAPCSPTSWTSHCNAILPWSWSWHVLLILVHSLNDVLWEGEHAGVTTSIHWVGNEGKKANLNHTGPHGQDGTAGPKPHLLTPPGSPRGAGGGEERLSLKLWVGSPPPAL